MARSWFVVFLLVGCKGDGEGNNGGIEAVAFVPGTIPGTGQVTFTSKADGDARVQMGLKGDPLDIASPVGAAADGVIPLLGLETGKAYELMVVVDEDGKDLESAVIEFTVPPPSPGVPPMSVASSDPAQMCDTGGYILFSYIGGSKSGVAIIDREANYVWTVAEEDTSLQVGRARPGRDGKSILWNDADAGKCEDVATITRQPIDGSEKTVTRTLQGHHDFVELPDGRMAWLGYRMEQADPPGGQDIEVQVAADVIYEADEGITDADTPDTMFDTWEHYPSGIYKMPADSVRDNGSPAFLCDAYEFGHGNSLAYVESTNSYYMMWRWLDTLLKVDRGNPADPYVWEMAPDPYGTLPLTSGEAFEHAHFSDVWDGGMLIFDNRNRDDLSRLVEYTYDDSSYEEVWSYETGAYEALLGDVRRIPVDGCDNLLVAFSNQGRIAEITRDGEIVWDATSAIGNVISRVYYLPDLYDFSGVAYPE